jgi:hypothetical protein
MDDEHNQLHGNQKMDADELEMEAQAATLEKTRKHRKEIEKDAQLLANRIALLT